MTAMNNLLKKGFPKGFVIWLRSYFSNRTGIVKLNSKAQELIPMERGVPQGSVLGPPIFCTYVQSLLAKSENATVVKYADDLSFVVPLKSDPPDDIQRLINQETDHVTDWCDKHGLIINSAKSRCLLITRRHVKNIGAKVDCVQSMRLLGVHLNN